MLRRSEKRIIEFSSILNTLQVLSDESGFNNISYHQYLYLAAKEENIALSLVTDAAVQSVADGLVMSILGSQHGAVGTKILSIPVLRSKLLGVDLEKLASGSRGIAIEILTSSDLKSRLKTHDIAAIGAEHPDLVDTIMQDFSLRGEIEYIHYGQLCKNNIGAAKRLIREKSTYMDGVEMTRIAQYHPEVSLSLIANKALRHKLDPESLVILSLACVEAAIAILDDSGFYEQLGPIGISRILANYDELAQSFIAANPEIIFDFDNISTACIVERSSSTALQLYKNTAYRSRTKIENSHIAWIEDALNLGTKAHNIEMKMPSTALLRTFEKVCVAFMLKNRISLPSGVQGDILQGLVAPMLTQMVPAARIQIIRQLVAQVQRMELDELMDMGNKSEEVANDILLHYKKRLLGKDLVLLGKDHSSIVKKILNDSELCEKLSGFNLVMISKNHPEVCRMVFADEVLREKIIGCHVGILALHDYQLLPHIFGDEDIKTNLTQKDLPLLCKRYIGVTKQALSEEALRSRFSEYYCERLQNRMAIVEVISKCAKRLLVS